MSERPAPDLSRLRREPPPLEQVSVASKETLSSRMFLVRFEGPGLRGLAESDPAASVRLLVPSPGDRELVIPAWTGNEFLRPDGSRPSLRTFTPLQVDRVKGALDLWIVRHPGGAVSTWAEAATVGSAAAISGPGKGYPVDAEASRFVLLGDETALPAISDLLGVLPDRAALDVTIEVEAAAAQIDLPDHPGLSLAWQVRERSAPPGAALVRAAEKLDEVDESTRVWAAGEAASMQAIRKHLFNELGVPRAQASVRGYWKPAR